MEKQLDELKAKMEQSNLALAKFETDLDVLDDDKSNILSIPAHATERGLYSC